MKKIAQVLAIALTVFTSAAFASGTDKGKSQPAEQVVSVSIQPSENTRSVEITAVNADNSKVSVTIYDAAGETVYSEIVSTSPKIHRAYNLASLPAGTYSVSIVADNYSVNKNIEVR